MVLGRVGVAGEAHGEPPTLEQREQRLAIGQVAGGVSGVEIGAQRDMRHEDDQRVLRRMREDVANEFELRRIEPALVFAGAVRLGLVGAEIVDVVEHQEQRLGVEERVIVRAEHAPIGLAAVAAVGRLVIEVVVAADIPPGQADRADDLVVAVVEREIVEHDVAGGEAEFRARPRERVDHVLADEIDFRVRLRLRIGEHDDFEGARLVLAERGKSSEAGSGPVGAIPSKVSSSEAGEPSGRWWR